MQYNHIIIRLLVNINKQYQCGCGTQVGSIQCEDCKSIYNSQINPIDSYSTAIFCTTCNDTKFTTPCPKCYKINLRHKNAIYIKCSCGMHLQLVTCPTCNVQFVTSNAQLQQIEGKKIKCPNACTDPFTPIKCPNCKFYNCMPKFDNQGQFPCKNCKKDFYKLYCSECSRCSEYTKQQFIMCKYSKTGIKCTFDTCEKLIQFKIVKNQTLLNGVFANPPLIQGNPKQKIQQLRQQQSADLLGLFENASQVQKSKFHDLLGLDEEDIPNNNPNNNPNPNSSYKQQCKACKESDKLCMLYPCGHKLWCRDCIDTNKPCRECQSEIRSVIINAHNRDFEQENIQLIMLKQISELNSLGYYREAYKQIDQLATMLKQENPSFVLFDKNQSQIAEICEFYTEYGNIALKLSLLEQAKKAVECSFYYLNLKFDLNLLIQNTLTYQRIDYWLCKYLSSCNILKCLLPIVPDSNVEDLAEIYHQIANALRAWCCQEEAEQFINKATDLLGQIKNPLIRSNILFVKARLYMDTDRSAIGIDLALECLDLRLVHFQNLNKEHPDIALAQELVGKLYFALNNMPSAQIHHDLAYQLKIKVYGLYNFETIDSINERGRLQLSTKKEKEAIINFALIGEISHLLLGQCNQYQALSHNNLGCALFNMGKYEESIIHHQQALQIYEKLCGSDHQKLFFSLNQMASASKQLQRYRIANLFWCRCVSILEKSNPILYQKQINQIKQQIVQIVSQFED